MSPSFCPRLVNGPFEDPGLFVPFQFERRALLFDLGDVSSLPPKDLLKTSHVFISHAHMDHMVGFDHLLRLFLGREKQLRIYGPRGLLGNIEGKLAGYSWNLVHNYGGRFSIRVYEVGPGYLKTQQFPCHTGFLPDRDPVREPFDGVLLREPGLTVSSETLDHSIPSLGFSARERFHVNIKGTAVADLGLEIGPWLGTLKQALFSGQDPETIVDVPCGSGETGTRRFTLGDLSKRIARITPGQKVAYIADAVYSGGNAEKMVGLARDADHLFIEAAFLHRDREIAERKYHLTAAQAGRIAGEARARRFTLFHFSPRYRGEGHLFEAEAQAEYRKHSRRDADC